MRDAEIARQNLCLKEIQAEEEPQQIMLVLVVAEVPVRQLLIFQIKVLEQRVQEELVVQVQVDGPEIVH
jgi:hypothetical protein